MDDKVPIIMESVFECTLEMINKDFHEYPEHRVQFFKLLQAINLYCFPALLKLDGNQFKFVIDSCMWASKHDNREVENTGLTMCLELMNNMAETDLQTSSIFFRQFYLAILQDVFFVLTDTDHKSGEFTLRPEWSNILLTFVKDLNHRRCFCRECSTSSSPVKYRSLYIRRSRRLPVLQIRTFCKNMLPVFFNPPSRTYKS